MRAVYRLAFLFAAAASAARAPACFADVADAPDASELETPEGASVSLLQTGILFSQHTIVTAEVDAAAEVVEGLPLERDESPSTSTEEVSLLSVTPMTVESSVTAGAPGAPLPRAPTAAALLLAKMVKEDRDAKSGSRLSAASRRGPQAPAGGTVWRYKPYNKLMADIRAVPAVSGERTEFEIHPGALFRVQEELRGDDGITYLKLADGRGWLFDRLSNGGVMCMREETPKDLGAALLETVTKFRSGFQATGATTPSRVTPRGHRGGRLTNLLIPIGVMVASIIAFLVASRFARPQPVDHSSHVRPYMRPPQRFVSNDAYKADGLLRSRSPVRVAQAPGQVQAFNLLTGAYEASSPFGSQTNMGGMVGPSRIVSRELPPVQAQVIQQQQFVQVASPMGGPVPLAQMAGGRGRSPPRVRQAVTLEAGMDLHSTRLLVPQPSTRQCSAPPGVDRAGRAEMSFAEQWKPAAQLSRSVQLVPQTVPSLGSAQAALLAGPEVFQAVPLGR